MFLDKALCDLLSERMPVIRTDAGAAWIEDAFDFLITTHPAMLDQIKSYLRSHIVNVRYDHDRTAPVFPLINIGAGQYRTKPTQGMGNSRRSVSMGEGAGRIEYRYEMNISNVRVQCMTRNPDQTLYLWLCVQKILIANQPYLYNYYGVDHNNAPRGYYGIEFSGEGLTYPLNVRGADAYARDVTVSASFNDRVAQRVTPRLAESITLNVNCNEETEAPRYPWDAGEFE